MSQAERLKEEARDRVLRARETARNRPSGSRYYRLDINGKEYVHDYAKSSKGTKKAHKVGTSEDGVLPGVGSKGGGRPHLDGRKSIRGNANQDNRNHAHRPGGVRHRHRC